MGTVMQGLAPWSSQGCFHCASLKMQRIFSVRFMFSWRIIKDGVWVNKEIGYNMKQRSEFIGRNYVVKLTECGICVVGKKLLRGSMINLWAYPRQRLNLSTLTSTSAWTPECPDQRSRLSLVEGDIPQVRPSGLLQFNINHIWDHKPSKQNTMRRVSRNKSWASKCFRVRLIKLKIQNNYTSHV